MKTTIEEKMSKFVTAKEARKILGISSATLMRWRNSYKIPTMQVSKKKVLYDVENVSNPVEADEELRYACDLAMCSGNTYESLHEWMAPLAHVTPCRNTAYISPDGTEAAHRVSNPQFDKGKVPLLKTHRWEMNGAHADAVAAIVGRTLSALEESAPEAEKVEMMTPGAMSDKVRKFIDDNPYHMPPTALVCSRRMLNYLNPLDRAQRELLTVKRREPDGRTMKSSWTAFATEGFGMPLPVYVWTEEDEDHEYRVMLVRSRPHESGMRLVMGLNPIESVKITDRSKEFEGVEVAISINASAVQVGEVQCEVVDFSRIGKSDGELVEYVVKLLERAEPDERGSVEVVVPYREASAEDVKRVFDALLATVRERMHGYRTLECRPDGSGNTKVRIELMRVAGVGDNPADFERVKE